MAIQLHLRISVKPERLTEFHSFLANAIPYYEEPGGIQISLLELEGEMGRFIEVVRYATQAGYDSDQIRVESDPKMREFLDAWRALLVEPPIVEVWREVPVGQLHP